MMHLTFAGRILIVGTDVARLVVEYAAVLARSHSADTVRLSAYDAGGESVEATLLLDDRALLMIETTATDLCEPDNDAAVGFLRKRLRKGSAPVRATPIESVDDLSVDDFDIVSNAFYTVAPHRLRGVVHLRPLR